VRIKVSDYIVNYFSEKGIDKCFCVTGGGAMHFNDSFGHHDGFKVIYNHHEQAAAMAAEGYARVSLRPAIVSVTSGPGTTNAITGVLGAWLDSIPMIIISGQMKSETILASTPADLRYLGFQEANILKMVSPITKYAVSLNNIKDLQYHLDKAYHMAISGRKGPVWLDVPMDVQGSFIDDSAREVLMPVFVPGLSIDTAMPSPALISQILSNLNSAHKPVLMLGEEVRLDGAADIVSDLIQKLKIPVVTEWNAHDLVGKDNEFYCGRPGTIGDRGGNYVVQNADLLITIGCQLSIRQISYEWKNFAKNALIVSINIDENELQKPTLKIDTAVVCSPRNFILAMLENRDIPNCHGSETSWYKWCRNIHSKYPVVQDKYFEQQYPLNIYPFIQALSRIASDNSIVVLANGAACVCGLQAYDIKPNTRIFTNAGASSMGYGIAASVGASVAAGNGRTTICIEGDGSIMMNLQELQTIVENDLNIKMFVINNDGYHSIKQTQRGLFSAEERGYCGADKHSGISFPAVEGLANAFNMPFFRIASLADLEPVLSEFLMSDGYGLCEVVVDPDQNFEPKLGSVMNDDGSFYTPSLEIMAPALSNEEHEENSFE
jgi:acetolactate synthase-1/2/3 large subunit